MAMPAGRLRIENSRPLWNLAVSARLAGWNSGYTGDNTGLSAFFGRELGNWYRLWDCRLDWLVSRMDWAGLEQVALGFCVFVGRMGIDLAFAL